MKIGSIQFNPRAKYNLSKHVVSNPLLRQPACDAFEKQNKTSNTQAQISMLGNNLHYPTIKTMIIALNDKDPYTNNHSERVALYSLLFAKELNISELEEVETAGLLHDIGKIIIPNSILCKEGRLTSEEYEIIKTHPNNSELLLQGYDTFSEILPAIKHHHERWDGFGYPNGIEKEKIPYIARIIMLADTYDAMTSVRAYRNAIPHKETIEEIKRCANHQFDPELTEKFIKAEELMYNAKNHPQKYKEKYSILTNKIN